MFRKILSLPICSRIYFSISYSSTKYYSTSSIDCYNRNSVAQISQPEKGLFLSFRMENQRSEKYFRPNLFKNFFPIAYDCAKYYSTSSIEWYNQNPTAELSVRERRLFHSFLMENRCTEKYFHSDLWTNLFPISYSCAKYYSMSSIDRYNQIQISVISELEK